MFLALTDAYRLVRSRFRSRVDPFATLASPMRVWPHHLDALIHMNNGTYLTLATFARWEFVIRSGYGDIFRRLGWYGVIAGQVVRYRRGLRLWQRFAVETRFLGLDGPNIVFEHRFVRGGEVVARVIACIRMLDRRGGTVRREDLLAAVPDPRITDVPEWAARWTAVARMPMTEADVLVD
ncbi:MULTISPECIES: acyl-CoA thioesterase [Catenuloplanes]|uniref:Acyl-CoA thioesterase FadM n=1 Tax=Catenuloplanes niger TaxID=587534 RepID=A0AAE3ZYR1_9ACTN|nr:acyl-CoA thioesterase [Catenuloplanes niger]MDR7328312.1 acyl-CoA thioesterase FadM [Catenuloplanes niger]